MGNPARELHNQFLKWNAEPNAAAYITRKMNAGEGQAAAFDEHIRAMRLIAECETALVELERAQVSVATYRRAIRKWAAAVMNFPNNWLAVADKSRALSPFEDIVMDTLDNFAVLLEARGAVINPGGIARVRKLLGDVVDLLVTDTSISDDMRGHVYEIVQTLTRCLEDAELYGEADVRQAIYDLWIALNAAAGQSDEEHRPKWQTFVRDIWTPAAGTILGSVPTLALGLAQLAGQ